MTLNKLIITLMIIVSIQVKSQDLGSKDCDSLLLVSSWQNDNVKIFDGCDYSYISDLDSESILDGPQSMFLDGNGDLIVVSEQNHRLVKYDKETLSNATIVAGDDPNTAVVEPRLVNNPLATAFHSDGNLLLGGYSQNEIVKVNTKTWESIQTILPISTEFISGLDIGMAIGPDGQLYVPGFDSDNIIKINLDTLSVTEVVPAGGGGLNAPRSIVFYDNQMYVTGWANNAIKRYDLNGNFIDNFIAISRPAGMAMDGDNHILVTSDNSNIVGRISLLDTSVEILVPSNSPANINGATFVYRLKKNDTIYQSGFEL